MHTVITKDTEINSTMVKHHEHSAYMLFVVGVLVVVAYVDYRDCDLCRVWLTHRELDRENFGVLAIVVLTPNREQASS